MDTNNSDKTNEELIQSDEVTNDSIKPNETSDSFVETGNIPEPEKIKCLKCNQLNSPEDPFCTSCGSRILSPEENESELKENQEFITRLNTEARKSARGILILGILFAISGTIMGFMNKKNTDDALKLVSNMKPSQIIDIGGKSLTVKEVRRKIKFEFYQVFIVNYFLSAVMFGLWFWARKNLFPAMVSALAIFLAVNVFNAAIDPSSIYKGIIIKIIIIIVFANGISKALKVRELMAKQKAT